MKVVMKIEARDKANIISATSVWLDYWQPILFAADRQAYVVTTPQSVVFGAMRDCSLVVLSSSMGFPPNEAHPACKFQSRKCTVDCLLAPWFSPDQPRWFANAYRLFGVANILRLIRENRSSVEDLMKSVSFESDGRERDPVNGVYGTLRYLQREAEILEENGMVWSEKLRVLLVEDAANNVTFGSPTISDNHEKNKERLPLMEVAQDFILHTLSRWPHIRLDPINLILNYVHLIVAVGNIRQ
ncbi:hypothetical protein AXG93_3218s1000 [Marchantia polymorpha subsp. ruderalis]|uniref:LOB domain-containing protein n=1 Tax=Marchantia polymorpha subsp. ruderalis TaxID=1480154 RepID=A0A176WGQ4_MARPO|nr:hypothetical protein AXG93_3218s1000 [Marchantia polymorpha subsp. ruderalis]